jgi:uroporphyrinogen-III synthase
VSLPLIAIRVAPAEFSEQLRDGWAALSNARAAMFVSANAVHGFFAETGRTDWPSGARAWATGPGTRQALLDHGVSAAQVDSPDHEASQFDSESLWEAVAGQVAVGSRVLIVRGAGASGDAIGREWLADRIRARGGVVQVVASYSRGLPAWTAGERLLALDGAAAGAWLFSSSQAVAHLQQLLPDVRWSRARAVATHARIAQAARDACFGVVCVSRPGVDDVARALESFR